MKNNRLFAVIAGIVALVILYFFSGSEQNPIGEGASIDRVTFHGVAGDMLLIRTPFIADSHKYEFANVGVDLNKNGAIDEGEWLVVNTPVFVENDTATRYSLRHPDTSIDGMSDIMIQVVLSRTPLSVFSLDAKKSISKQLIIPEVTAQEMGGAFDPDRSGQSETGFFSSVNADHGDHEDDEVVVPDEKPAEGGNMIVDVDFTIDKGEEIIIVSPDIVLTEDDDEIKFEMKVDSSEDIEIVDLKFTFTEEYSENIWINTDKYYDLEYELDDDSTTDDSVVEPPTLTLIEDEPTVTPAPVPEEVVIPEEAPRRPRNLNFRDMPDINQKYNECAPTAVANSFRWLAKRHGFEDRIPSGDQNLIDEIKGYMMWDFGTKPGNSLQGKKDFIKERELPIEAHLIGNGTDADLFTKIFDEMIKGQAVELSLQFYVFRDGEWKKDGAHLVAVSGISDYTNSGGNQWITLSDPGTHESDGSAGRDPYTVEGNRLPNYWSGGRTQIRYAIAQSPILNEDGTLISMGSNSELQVDDATGLTLSEQTVTRAMGHFGFFQIDLGGAGDHYVGDSFPVSLRVSSTGRENTIRWAGETYKVKMTGPWSINGSYSASSNISPNTTTNTPPTTSLNTNSYGLTTTFTCSKKGTAYIEYTANLRWARTGEGPPPTEILREYSRELRSFDTITVRSPSFRCVEKPVVVEEESLISVVPDVFICDGFSPDPDGRDIELLKLGSKCYPKFQFRGGGNAHDACGFEHYHGARSNIVYSLQGDPKPDPDVNACGFGKVSEVRSGTIKLSADQMAPFLAESVFSE